MHEEWHVTVKGDPFQWRGICAQLGIKPLWIELNNFERQLMSASGFNPLTITNVSGQSVIEAAGFKVERIKHEVQPSDPAQLGRFGPDDVVYYECHIKLDGPFMPQLAMSSRDLFRDSRWYLTRRSAFSFEPSDFLRRVQQYLMRGQMYSGDIAGWEYEVAVMDTNRGIDHRWVTASNHQIKL